MLYIFSNFPILKDIMKDSKSKSKSDSESRDPILQEQQLRHAFETVDPKLMETIEQIDSLLPAEEREAPNYIASYLGTSHAY